MRKALKTEQLPFVPVNVASHARGESAVRVKARVVAVQENLFELNPWCGQPGAEKLRLSVTLRDASGDIQVFWWNSTFGTLIPHNLDELAALWEACDDSEEGKKAFLEVINTSAGKDFSWTLRPVVWKKKTGESVLQWHVHVVNEVEG